MLLQKPTFHLVARLTILVGDRMYRQLWDRKGCNAMKKLMLNIVYNLE